MIEFVASAICPLVGRREAGIEILANVVVVVFVPLVLPMAVICFASATRPFATSGTSGYCCSDQYVSCAIGPHT